MIKFNNVSFTYKGNKLQNVKNINLHIKKGECVLISGKSGCGKTTVLRMINGLIPHFYTGKLEGSVIACNIDVASNNTSMYKIAEKIGMVYQNPRSQFFNVDTDSEIAFGIENLSYPRDELLRRVDKTIEDVNMSHLTGKGIFELSGGEKQKVAFGSIYAMEPEIYLLDEPSANLDTESTIQLQNRLKLLKEHGKTIIITEHRLYYLKNIVDRAIYMDNGEIKVDCNSKNFFTYSKKERTKMGLRVFDLNNIVLPNKVYNEDPYIFLQNVSIGYGKKVIVKDISFKATKGDIIAITGHNGAGKSTLAETLCGLKKAISGSIFVNGKIISQNELLKQSYMVMQDVDYQLFADSAFNECKFGLKNVRNKDIEKTLQLLNLFEFKEKHPATLSGGQKQRLAVAVSLLCNKDILIFDEPTSGLDLISMMNVTKLIKKLSELGKIIFVVTHDYEFISQGATRVINIGKKELLFDVQINENNKNKIKKCFVC